MTNNLAGVLLGKYPCRRYPALYLLRRPPARDVVDPLLDYALWAFNEIGCAKTLLKR
jgi:hypothetical protein